MKAAARTRKPGRAALPANSAVRALAVLGDRWTLLILRDAFLGVRRFGDFEARLGITPTVLARRLAQLVAAGVLRRAQATPARVDYHLTAKGARRLSGRADAAALGDTLVSGARGDRVAARSLRQAKRRRA